MPADEFGANRCEIELKNKQNGFPIADLQGGRRKARYPGSRWRKLSLSPS